MDYDPIVLTTELFRHLSTHLFILKGDAQFFYYTYFLFDYNIKMETHTMFFCDYLMIFFRLGLT